MANKICPLGDHCSRDRVPAWERFFLYVVAGCVLLSGPFSNALQIGVNENLANADVVLSAAIIFPIAGFLLTLYLAWKDEADSHWQVILNAIGAPGTLYVLLLALAR